MGSLIIQEVVKELVGKGLGNAKVLLLAGSRYMLGYEHYVGGRKTSDKDITKYCPDQELSHRKVMTQSFVIPKCQQIFV